MTDLGTFGGDSYATGVNDSGVVVGYSYLADRFTRHAFIWTAAAGMVDLGTLPGGTWTAAQAVNSEGEIVGEGDDSSAKIVPFFWSSTRGFRSVGENDGFQGNYGSGVNDDAVVVVNSTRARC